MKKTPARASDTLLEIANDKKSGQLTYQSILDRLGESAFGIALLFFALPSALPFAAIPGISFFFSIPIALFALQLIIGRKTLWLPKSVANRTVNKGTIAKVIHTSVPYLKKMEYLLKPRLPVMNSRFFEILNGFIIFCLSILLMLPIPFSNFILAFILIVFSLGLIEKDGVFIIVGYISTFVYISFVYVLIMAAIIKLFA
ncbi:MAG TPA: exopolysaccharide biosynthesis protein [Legionella sp.]|nr:exopolysaccharide biosynthesis protein [Legionella sp.]